MITIDAETVQRVDTWLDHAVAERYGNQPLAQDWARVGKAIEECGEAISALIAWTGQNPRKGVCGTQDELLAELADVVLTAVLAIQHFTKDTTETAQVLEASVQKVASRVPAEAAQM